MAWIGNSPGVASQRIVTPFTATAGQTAFVPNGGYALGYVDVFLNGSKLATDGSDFTATDGVTVNLIIGCTVGDFVELVCYMPRGLSDGYTKAEADAKYVGKDSSTGAALMPVGTTAQRPATPVAGMIRQNSTLGQPEWYDVSAASWKALYSGASYSLDVLLVAGGGGGGRNDTQQAGGGGAGGYIATSTTVVAGSAFAVTVGAGGTGATSQANGANGSDSLFNGYDAVGGGGGGGVNGNAGTGAQAGGSGGGGTGGTSNYTGASGTSGQGNPGGSGGANGWERGGGGGGAGAAGASGYPGTGNGGTGLNWQSLGTYYAGGGGGGTRSDSTAGSGGTGGGASGSNSGATAASATANTGGGGGGGGRTYGAGSGGNGGNGGSGIVIVRYLGTQKATGGTVTTSGGYTYHTFTSSGTFTA